MNDPINPQHYKHLPAEAIDIITAAIAKAPSNESAYLQGQVLKYLLRCWEKKGIEDLRKAKWYLDRMVDGFDEPSKPATPKTFSVEMFWGGPERPTKFYREPTLADLENGPIECEVRDLEGEPWKSGFLSDIHNSASLRFEGKTKVGIQERWEQCRIEVTE